MKIFTLKLIPGDGIGKEVMAAARKVLGRIEQLGGDLRFELQELDWGCQYYLRRGRMMPEDGLSILSDCDCILLGAIGFPGVPDHISLRGLLLPIRQGFDQYVNLRPIRFFEGLNSPLKLSDSKDIDFVVIRENSEGEYCGAGRIEYKNTPDETAVQEARFSLKGTERIIRYAFEYAKNHQLPSLISATKSNALNYSMVFWDSIFERIRTQYPTVEAQSIHVDALAGLFILNPKKLKVVVASNLFGDILTDLGSAMLGSIGISPSANLNPEKKYPSMFEPIHGSAPDIAGKGIANPIGMIWSIILMLQHLGLDRISEMLTQAMAQVICEKKVRTPDMGGNQGTDQVVEAVCGKLTKIWG